MKFSHLPLKPTLRALRQFAAAWLALFLVLALRALMRGHPVAAGVFGAVALMGLVGLWRPAAIRWLFIGAMVAAFPVGWLVTQLMLAIMFYLVLTPVAVIFRLRGRDELRLRSKPAQSSHWVERGEPSKAENYLKQF
jgi:hypothetical protein